MLKFRIESIDATRAYIDHDIRHILEWAHASHAALITTQARGCREAAAMLEASIRRLHAAAIGEEKNAADALARGQTGFKPMFESITRTADLIPFFLTTYDGGIVSPDTPPTVARYALASVYRHENAAPFRARGRDGIAPNCAAILEAVRGIKKDGRPIGTLDIKTAVRVLEAWRGYYTHETRAALITADKARLIDAKRDLIDLAKRAEGVNTSYGDDIPVSLYDATEAERGNITAHARVYIYFYLIALKKLKRYGAVRASRTYSDVVETSDIFERAADLARCPNPSGLCLMCRAAQEHKIRACIEAAARKSLNIYKWESARIRADALRVQIIARWF